ncbi:MAG: hypothetical protein Q8K51_14200, partial [Nitrospirota bacterium]|nr:hypothetical protein [Nitrospirota bacterium]
DAAVILSNNNGESSHVFYDLAVVINKDGGPYNVATEDLGDNIVIESLSIKNGEIIIRMKVHGTDDPACCPSTKKVVKYVLLNDKLTSKGIVDKVGTPKVPSTSEQHEKANSIQGDPYMAFVFVATKGKVFLFSDCSASSQTSQYILSGRIVYKDSPISAIAKCQDSGFIGVRLEPDPRYSIAWVKKKEIQPAYKFLLKKGTNALLEYFAECAQKRKYYINLHNSTPLSTNMSFEFITVGWINETSLVAKELLKKGIPSNKLEEIANAQ